MPEAQRKVAHVVMLTPLEFRAVAAHIAKTKKTTGVVLNVSQAIAEMIKR